MWSQFHHPPRPTLASRPPCMRKKIGKIVKMMLRMLIEVMIGHLRQRECFSQPSHNCSLMRGFQVGKFMLENYLLQCFHLCGLLQKLFSSSISFLFFCLYFSLSPLAPPIGFKLLCQFIKQMGEAGTCLQVSLHSLLDSHLQQSSCLET